MSIATTHPMLEIRRTRLLAIVVAAVALGALSTWTLGFALDLRADRAQPHLAPTARDVSSTEAVLAELDPTALSYVEAITAMSDAQLVAAFGVGPMTIAAPTARDVSSTEAVLAEPDPTALSYVEAITAMSDAQLVAAFGVGPVTIAAPTARDVSSTEAVLAELDPTALSYVEAITAMSDAQLAAAFGVGP